MLPKKMVIQRAEKSNSLSGKQKLVLESLGANLVAQMAKNLPVMQVTWV